MKLFHTRFCVIVVSVFSLQGWAQNSGFKVGEHSGKTQKLQFQVQISWFPGIDRNPPSFVPIIFKASKEDFQTQLHYVFGNSSFHFSEIIN